MGAEDLHLCGLRHVRFGYTPDHLIWSDLNLEVQQGETVACMGPSGSGKSTLLALLGGLITPSAGQVWFRDERAQQVGWIQQTTNVFGSRTVIENVAMGAYQTGVGPTRALTLARAALETIEMAGFERRQVSSLSGGEVQRVVIARAVVSGADLLLADEPTGQLDATTTELVLDAIAALMQLHPHMALLIATHDAAVAARCDRHLMVHDGQLHEAECPSAP